MKSLSLSALGRDIARAARNRSYEIADNGMIHLSSAKAFIGGVFACRHAPAEEFGPAVIGANKFVNEGLNHVMNVLGGHETAQPLFIAPFVGNVSVGADWKASTFKDVATEFTAYTASSRMPWTSVPSTAQSLNNTAALAAATLTLAAGGPYTIRGAAMLTADGKAATTGLLLVAARFGADMTGLQAGGKLSFEYTLSALDEGA